MDDQKITYKFLTLCNHYAVSFSFSLIWMGAEEFGSLIVKESYLLLGDFDSLFANISSVVNLQKFSSAKKLSLLWLNRWMIILWIEPWHSMYFYIIKFKDGREAIKLKAKVLN